MIDLVSIIIASGAIIIAVTTHIKYSSCWGFKMETYKPRDSPETTPLLSNSPAILTPINTQPLDITNKRKIIKNWL